MPCDPRELYGGVQGPLHGVDTTSKQSSWLGSECPGREQPMGLQEHADEQQMNCGFENLLKF